MTETTTEKRLEDLAKSTDRGFDRVDGDIREVRAGIDGLRTEMNYRFAEVRAEMKEGFAAVDNKFAAVDTKFGRVDTRFEAMQDSLDEIRKLMIRFFAGTLGSIVAAVIAMILAHS